MWTPVESRLVLALKIKTKALQWHNHYLDN